MPCATSALRFSRLVSVTWRLPRVTIEAAGSFTRQFTQVMAPTSSDHHRPVVISGPSGSGKSTHTKELLRRHPGRFLFSISHTTRSPRHGERHGVDYYYVSREEFEELIANGGFIEHAKFGSNLYGTSRAEIERIRNEGLTPLLDIEMEGVKQIHQTDLRARFLFLSPPSLEILESRLRGRGTDKEEDIQSRLKQARLEMEYSKTPGVHDQVVVNDDLNTAFNELEAFCLAE